MKELLGLIAAGLGLFAYLPYLRDTIRKTTLPHPYSWLVWGLSSAILWRIQSDNNAGPGAWTTASLAVLCLVVFALSVHSAAATIRLIDSVFLLASLGAILLYWLAGLRSAGLSVLLIADLIAIVPTVRKSWTKPEQETLSLWIINGVRHVIALFALTSLNVFAAANPVLWIACDFGVAFLLVVRRKQVNRLFLATDPVG